MDSQTGQAVPIQGLSEDSILVQHALQQDEAKLVFSLPADPLFESPD